jgi:hypothetical protein
MAGLLKRQQSTDMGTRDRHALNHDIEQELTLRLERAQRANDAAQQEIDRAMKIADELRSISSESSRRVAVATRDR